MIRLTFVSSPSVPPLPSPSLSLSLSLPLQLELKQAETHAASNGAAAAAAAEDLVAPYSRSYGRTPIAAALRPASPGASGEGNLSLVGTELTVGGWVRTGREALAGALAFVGLNDGSCQGVLQVVLPAEVAAAFAAEQAAAASPPPSPSGSSPARCRRRCCSSFARRGGGGGGGAR